jgi:pimeloyl-ACP methyl ester carboxylesterase
MKSYKLVGHGPQKVLLFPGLMGTQDAFDDMLQYADVAGFQYAIVDYRGYGASKNLEGLFTLREAVVDACKLVEFLGWRQFAVGGHSLGALAAQMLAIAMPHRVFAIVSIAGVSSKGATHDPARVELMQAAANSPEKRELIATSGTANRYSTAFAHAMVAATFDKINPTAFASYANDAGRTDVSEEVKKLSAPILALVGEHDPACSERAARETTAKFYQTAEIQVIAGAGHYPIYETPVLTINAIERFIGQFADQHPDAAVRLEVSEHA